MRRVGVVLVWAVIAGFVQLSGQVPQPFPGRPAPTRPAPAAPRPAPPSPTAPAPTPGPAPVAEAPAALEAAPTEATLGFPIYPSAQFIRSYDAGRGQQYHLFGSDVPFAGLVKYYQGALKTRGTLVFDAPATHMFEVGRFREEAMAFPPGVTIKDYTWNGSAGYLNPNRSAQPARFPTIIQIVAAPMDAPR